MRIFFFALVFFVMARAMASDSGLVELRGAEKDEFLRELRSFLSGVRGVRADFTQERRAGFFKVPLRSRGVCCFERPDKLRWETREPFFSLLVRDGGRVAMFEMKDSALRRLELGDSDAMGGMSGQMTDWMRGDFEAAGASCDLRVMRGEGRDVLTLVPKRRSVESIELEFDPATRLVRTVTIREDADNEIRIVFENGRTNPDFGGGVFSVDKPSELVP